MMRIEAMPVAELNDADLVAESLKGDREAFQQIVERYQTLASGLQPGSKHFNRVKLLSRKDVR